MARTAELQDVHVARDGSNLQVQLTLSAEVQASVERATGPDRLIIVLPGTVYRLKPQLLDLDFNGVRRVKVAQHSTNPDTVHVVIDLDQVSPYTLETNGHRIVLVIQLQAKAHGNGALTAGKSAGITGLFKRAPKPPPDAVQSPVPLSPPEQPHSSVAFNPSAPAPVNPSGLAATSSNSSTLATAAPPPETHVATVPQSYPTTTSPQSSAGQPTFPQADATRLAQPERKPVATSNLTASAGTTSEADNTAPSKSIAPDRSPAPARPVAVQADSSGASNSQGERPTTAATAQSAVPAGVDRPTLTVRTPEPGLRTSFRVKYVAEGVAYLDGGRSSGLTEGMKLEVLDTGLIERQAAADPADLRVVAELEITGLAETSAVTDIHSPKRPVKAGDLAYLSSADSEALVQQHALSATRKYPAVISFTEGDPMEEEIRDAIPRPPMPSVNRARGRIGVDYMGTISHGSGGMTSSDVGLIVRTDITRINGTYWNASGYWRGRLSQQSPQGQQTLQDLINRTYHLSMTYDNPNSAWVAGFGRLYLPWASSLETLDGGYFGRKLSKATTIGIFGGSTPDPTSYSYSPDQVIGGGFVNFEGGDYDQVHYSSTSGGGISMLKWQMNKPFVFFENTVSYKRYVSVYDALQVDSPTGNPAVPSPGPGIGRNFFTFRVQPHPRVEFDLNYNYFRDIPTFDPTLIGTGLLDKFLFQGFSVGTRVEVKKQIFIYTNLGQSNRTGDAKNSLNQLYGLTFNHLPWFALRADAHYSRFSSSFGDGSYKSFSLSRNMNDNMRTEILVGDQTFTSQFTSSNRSRFITGNIETNFGPHYFIQGGFTTNRGQFSYDQWMFTLGYRFDSKERRHE